VVAASDTSGGCNRAGGLDIPKLEAWVAAGGTLPTYSAGARDVDASGVYRRDGRRQRACAVAALGHVARVTGVIAHPFDEAGGAGQSG